MDASRLYDRLTSIRLAIESGFAARGITLPDLTYSHIGEVSYDCLDGQLSVTASGIFLGQPGTRGVGAKQIGPRGLIVTIHLYRCITAIPEDAGNTAIMPTAAQFEADAEMIGQDGTVLVDVVLDAWRAGTLFEDCDHLSFISMTPYGPEGRAAGWQLQLEVSLS